MKLFYKFDDIDYTYNVDVEDIDIHAYIGVVKKLVIPFNTLDYDNLRLELEDNVDFLEWLTKYKEEEARTEFDLKVEAGLI